MAPLLFVCRSVPVRPRARLARASLATIETPRGPAFMAFASHDLAAGIVALYGAAPGVVLVPETRFTPELVESLTTHPVVIFRTFEEYDGAVSNRPGFRWDDCIVDYDFVAALKAVRPIGQEHSQGD